MDRDDVVGPQANILHLTSEASGQTSNTRHALAVTSRDSQHLSRSKTDSNNRKNGPGKSDERLQLMSIGTAAGSAIFFGSAGIVAKALGTAGFTPLQLAWLRLPCGTITLTLCALVLRPRSVRITMTSLPVIVS